MMTEVEKISGLCYSDLESEYPSQRRWLESTLKVFRANWMGAKIRKQ